LNTDNEGAAVKPATHDPSLSPTLSADNGSCHFLWRMTMSAPVTHSPTLLDVGVGWQNNVKMTANTVRRQWRVVCCGVNTSRKTVPCPCHCNMQWMATNTAESHIMYPSNVMKVVTVVQQLQISLVQGPTHCM